ncbi:MAG TPA: cupredoxin domain-containing protein [Pseudomonadales bacterium]|nr:cupredoxin domain-containing protein [Pseudomonadales bacterium]
MWLVSFPVLAARPQFEIEIKNHMFYPDRIVIPANTKVRLIVHNRDTTPEEFESFELNREKVIAGESTTAIFVGPLNPGAYPFFGEFNLETAQGMIIAE